MVEDRPENNGSLPDSDRPRREPPTIDLKATEVTSETVPASDGAAPEAEPEAPSASAEAAPAPAPVSPWIIAPISGAVAAALVIGVGWLLGWPAVQPASIGPAPHLN